MNEQKDEGEIELGNSVGLKDVALAAKSSSVNNSVVVKTENPASQDEHEHNEGHARAQPARSVFDWVFLIVNIAITVAMFGIFFGALSNRYDVMDAGPPKGMACNVQVGYTTSIKLSTNKTIVGITSASSSAKTPFLDCPASFKKTVNNDMKIALSLIPFGVVFQGILSYRLSSKKVSVAGMVVVTLLGMVFFVDTPNYLNLSLAETMGKVALICFDRVLWTFFDYALNMGSALFFLALLQQWGVLEQIRREFQAITSDSNMLIMLIMFCFGMILAVVAPGGSNYILAGAILIKMKMPSTATETERARLVKEYDERHASCTDEDCPHATATEADKVQTDSNNRVATIALFGNALASAFNLLGVCIVATVPLLTPFDPVSQTLEPDEAQARGELELGRLFAAAIWFPSVLSPFIMNYILSPGNGCWARLTDPALSKCERAIFLVVGMVYASTQLLIAAFVGPELPCLLAGMASLVTFILLAKGGAIYRREWPEKQNRRYLLPFILLMVTLICIRLIPGLEPALTGEDQPDSMADQVLSPKFSLFGWNKAESTKGYSKVDFPWLVHSGVIVCCITLITPFLVPYEEQGDTHVEVPKNQDGYEQRELNDLWSKFAVTHKTMHKFKSLLHGKTNQKQTEFRARYKSAIRHAWTETLNDTMDIIVVITSFASMAKLMADFGMTSVLAEAMAGGLVASPNAFALVSPLIGMLGSALTGSTTTSNFLFSSLQVNTAQKLEMISEGRNSVFEIGAIQILGASAGEIISPMNAVVITLLKGVDKKESALIVDLFPICLFWLSICILTSVVFIVPPDGGID